MRNIMKTRFKSIIVIGALVFSPYLAAQPDIRGVSGEWADRPANHRLPGK